VFGRLVRIDAPVSCQRLPSTSPANAIPLETKLAAWQAVSLS
jgi:G:T/U-mismatch repair DNA glycosylase